jgi:hypothetical protein
MVTVGAPPSFSLADLQALLRQVENVVGQITAIGNDGRQTVFTLDATQPSPATPAVMNVTIGGVAVPPPGMTAICSGNAIVAGNEQNIAVFR